MNETTNKPNTMFWIIGLVAIIWNSMGIHGYIHQAYQTEYFESQYSIEQLEIMSNQPVWVTAAFATAVFSGLLGSLFLLLRQKKAKLILTISLIAVVLQMSFTIYTGISTDIYGPGGITMPIMILVIAFYLVWFSNEGIKKRWLK